METRGGSGIPNGEKGTGKGKGKGKALALALAAKAKGKGKQKPEKETEEQTTKTLRRVRPMASKDCLPTPPDPENERRVNEEVGEEVQPEEEIKKGKPEKKKVGEEVQPEEEIKKGKPEKKKKKVEEEEQPEEEIKKAKPEKKKKKGGEEEQPEEEIKKAKPEKKKKKVGEDDQPEEEIKKGKPEKKKKKVGEEDQPEEEIKKGKPEKKKKKVGEEEQPEEEIKKAKPEKKKKKGGEKDQPTEEDVKRGKRPKIPAEEADDAPEDDEEEEEEEPPRKAPKRKHMIGTTPPPEAPPSLVRLRTKTSSDSLGEKYTTPPKRVQKFDSPMDTSSSKLSRSYTGLSDGSGTPVEAAPLATSSPDGRTVHVTPLNQVAENKIRSLSQSDIPIGERRALYNQLHRKMKSGIGLKPGLVEKYNAAAGSRKERFQLLKEFMIDPNMTQVEVEAYFVQESEKKNEDIYEKLPWFQLEETYSKTEAGRAYLERVKNSQQGEPNPQFPDDERFKLYKVYKKWKATSGDTVKSGSRTSAGGVVTDTTSKKALGEMLDTQCAELKKDVKEPKPKANANKSRHSADTSKQKQLQKDIKALRDKGQKARELMIDLNELNIPHQEAMGKCLKNHHKLFRDLAESMEDATFQKKSIDKIYKLKEKQATEIETAMEDIDNAASTVKSWRSRVNRKAKKEKEEKEKAKEKQRNEEEEQDEEEMPEYDGEEWDEYGEWGDEDGA